MEQQQQISVSGAAALRRGAGRRRGAKATINPSSRGPARSSNRKHEGNGRADVNVFGVMTPESETVELERGGGVAPLPECDSTDEKADLPLTPVSDEVRQSPDFPSPISVGESGSLRRTNLSEDQEMAGPPASYGVLVAELSLLLSHDHRGWVPDPGVQRKVMMTARNLLTKHKLAKRPDHDTLFRSALTHAYIRARPLPTPPLWMRILDFFRIPRTGLETLLRVGFGVAGFLVLSRVSLRSAPLGLGLALVPFGVRRKSVARLSRHPYVVDFCTSGHIARCSPGEIAGWVTCDSHVCNPTYHLAAFTIAPQHIWIPRPCTCNLLVALERRQLIKPAVSDDTITMYIAMGVDRLVRDLGLHQLYAEAQPSLPAYDAHECDDQTKVRVWYQHLPPNRVVAMKRFITPFGVVEGANGSITNGFVKVEVLTGKEPSKRHPRFISAKEESYLASVGPEYYHWQKWFTKTYCPNNLDELLTRRYIYPGGVDPVVLGQVVSHYEHLGWFVYEADFSRYDGHMEVPLLEAEMALYEFFGLPQRLIHLLSQQLETRGRNFPSDLRFGVSGKRASGVINTTMGNTLLGFAMAAGAMHYIGYKGEWVLIQMGDDNIILTSEPIDTTKYCEYISKCGHVLEMVDLGAGQDAYDRLTFCSALFWDIGGSRVLGPKPFRQLAKTFVPTNFTRKLRPSQVAEVSDLLMAHAAGVALGFKHYKWVPVLGEVCQEILSRWAPAKVSEDNPYRILLNKPVEVDRASVLRHFENRYGLHPNAVLELFPDGWASSPCSLTHPLLDVCLEIDGVIGDSTYEDPLY